MRRTIPVLVVVGLAVIVALLLINRDDEAPPDTSAPTSTTTSVVTTTVTQPTTTTTAGSTTTNPTEMQVVETVEEAEAILRELWFGWFEGIYNEDEERIREVVATEHQLELAVDQFDSLAFEGPPSMDGIAYSNTEILLATDTCTVVWTTATFSNFLNGETSDVHVLRWNDGWKFFGLWSSPDDLWEADCSAQLD